MEAKQHLINKKMKWKFLALIGVIFFTACQNNKTKKESATSVINKELVQAAEDAYIFSYPMVMMYRSMYLQALKPETGVGLGNWLHLGLSSPSDTTIVTPNYDTPYSYAWVDLRTEPYVLTMPKVEENRFYTSQWDDMFGYVLDNAGSVNDGNNGVNVLLAAPDYKGDLPQGITKIITGDSYILGSLTRTQLIDTKDLPNVKKVQQEYKLQPLSKFMGKEAPKAAPKIDWIKWEESAEQKESFWKFAGFISQFVVKHPEDKSQWDNLAKFGFEQGKDWDISKLDEIHKKALLDGQKKALTYLQQKITKNIDPKKFFNPREGMKHIGDEDQYEQRALGVMGGIFGNTKDISVYYSINKDINKNAPDASKSKYTLTFKKGELPNVKNFWSITMYRLPQRWLAPNEIERYSIGSSSPDMKTNADGSLTIYIQYDKPETNKIGNWLPSPNGQFWMVLRCYGPDKTIIEDTWPLPQLAPVK